MTHPAAYSRRAQIGLEGDCLSRQNSSRWHGSKKRPSNDVTRVRYTSAHGPSRTPTCAQSQTCGDTCPTGRKPRHRTATGLDVPAQRCPCSPVQCGAFSPVRCAERRECGRLLHVQRIPRCPSESTLGSAAPPSPKVEETAASALVAAATCAPPPWPAARTRAKFTSPEGAKSNMRVTVEC